MRHTGFRLFRNYITKVDKSIYKDIYNYYSILDSVTRITSQCLYLIDFYKGELLYVSNNPMFICGLTPQEVKDLREGFNKKFVSEQENKMTNNGIAQWFKFLENQPINERVNYSLNYDYLLNNRMVNTSLTTIFLSDDFKPWLVLGKSKVSTSSKSGNFIIFKSNSNLLWTLSEKSNKWKQSHYIDLSDIEKQVLLLSIQGKKEKEICDDIFRSLDGLKSIKRRLFNKLQCNNITEAVSTAISHNLL